MNCTNITNSTNPPNGNATSTNCTALGVGYQYPNQAAFSGEAMLCSGGEYTFKITDVYGDGMRSAWKWGEGSDGSYVIELYGEVIHRSDGDYGFGNGCG